MRICVVLASRPVRLPSGGVEKATQALCQGLLRTGNDVTLIASGMRSDEPWPGVPTVRIAPSHRRMFAGGARDWDTAVGQVLDDLRPDVAVAEGLGFAGSAVVQWHGGVRVVVAHGNIARDTRHAYSLAGWAARAPFIRARSVAAVRDADALVNVTEDWRVNCPVAPTHHVHIPNPIDDAFYASVAASEPGVVVCFGGSRRIKGVDLLLSAWPLVLRRVPSASLHLYGYATNGPAPLPPNCTILDALGTSDATAEAMARASVVVVPSRFEVSPLLVAEAMAVGVPIVATDVGGVRAMSEGVAALCRVEPREMSAGIIQALQEPSAWQARLRDGQRRSAAYRADAVTASFISLFESLT
jgi:glycosyltransferase involved in cell wall biosynthesis